MSRTFLVKRLAVVCLVSLFGWLGVLSPQGGHSTRLVAAETVTVERDGRQEAITGEVIVEAEDGGLLVMDRARRLWTLMPEEIKERSEIPVPFESFDRKEMAEQLQQQLPGFRIHQTAHYVIAYNTSPAYAKWCGTLFERLYRAFLNYWRERDLEIEEPEWPLVALVFNSRQAYAAHAASELGAATASIIGYYSLATNQVTTYDLTGADGRFLNARSAQARINAILSRPQAERTVATIIHEATHQLAFNCGLQTRYADIPLWVSEGQAIYFETPDLRSTKGWRTIGALNRVRHAGFRRYLPRRPIDSLRTLIISDARFQGRGAADAYAEAWALNYFLIRQHSEEYAEYMRNLSKKRPMVFDAPEQRLELFQACFGDDLAQLDKQFVRYLQSVSR